jgi:hypothetical protein
MEEYVGRIINCNNNVTLHLLEFNINTQHLTVLYTKLKWDYYHSHVTSYLAVARHQVFTLLSWGAISAISVVNLKKQSNCVNPIHHIILQKSASSEWIQTHFLS